MNVSALSRTPETSPSIVLEAVQSRWSKLLYTLRQRDHLNLQALLRSGRPVAVQGSTIVILFKHSFHKEQVERSAHRHVLESVLADLMGRPVQVHSVLPDEWELLRKKRPRPKTDTQIAEPAPPELEQRIVELRQRIRQEEARLAELEAARAEHNGLRTRLETLRRRILDEEKQIELLRVRREQLGGLCQEATLKLEMRRKEMTAQEQHFDKLQRESASLARQVAELRAHREEMAAEKRRIDDLREESASLEQRINELSSTEASLKERLRKIEAASQQRRSGVDLPPIPGLQRIIGGGTGHSEET